MNLETHILQHANILDVISENVIVEDKDTNDDVITLKASVNEHLSYMIKITRKEPLPKKEYVADIIFCGIKYPQSRLAASNLSRTKFPL